MNQILNFPFSNSFSHCFQFHFKSKNSSGFCSQNYYLILWTLSSLKKTIYIIYSTKTNLPKVSNIGRNREISIFSVNLFQFHINTTIIPTKTKLYIMDLPSYCTIIGTDWLSTHNPKQLTSQPKNSPLLL
jgi:hypothetical protein